MGDSFKKVRSGDPLQIPAETFNSFIDAARDFKVRQQSIARSTQSGFQQSGIIPVKNNSGSDRNRFDVLGIDRPIFTPSERLSSFQNQVAFVGVTPSETNHFGKFVILMEPIRAGRIGMACVSGVTVARLCIQSADHEYADVEEGQTANLNSGTSGSAYILWCESPSGGYCGYGYGYGGLVWGIVRIGNISEKPATGWGEI